LTPSGILIYPPLGTQTGVLNEPPFVAIAGDQTGLAGPYGIAIDSGGKIYVANNLFPSGTVTIYPPITQGWNLNEHPLASLESGDTGLAGPNGIALDSTGNIYVSNETGGLSLFGNITIYSPPSTGGTLDQKPIASIGGNSRLAFPDGLARDPSGNLYVANPPDNSITVYPSGSHGDTAPTATIGDQSTQVVGLPIGAAVDPDGNLVIAGGSATTTQACGIGGGNAIAIFPPLGNRTGFLSETPATITGLNTLLSSPFGIAFDLGRNIYVANAGNIVTVYKPGSLGNVAPVGAISGATTQLSSPAGIALDSEGRVYVANTTGGPSGAGAITVYPPPPSSALILTRLRSQLLRAIALD
jgi:hypothetical protein